MLFMLLATCVNAVATEKVGQDRWTLHTADGIELQVLDINPGQSGSPVVALHGGPGGEYTVLLPSVLPLANERRIVLFDQRGSLRSPAVAEAIGFDVMVEDIEQLRIQLKAPRISLLAHSMGSLLAYAYAATYPQHVDRMVLVAPAWPRPLQDAGSIPGLYRVLGLPGATEQEIGLGQKRKQVLAEAAIASETKRLGLNADPDNDVDRSHVARINYAAWSIHDISRWQEITQDAEVYNNRGVYARWVSSLGGISAFNSRWASFFPALQRLGRPITFVVGERDLNTEPSLWPKLVPKIPLATLISLADAGHLSWIDQPQATVAAVRLGLQRGP